MSVFKNTFSRALSIIPSDSVIIPYIGNSVLSNTITGTAVTKLIDSTATFKTKQVAIGDIVYNNNTFQSANVTGIDSETQLSIDNNIFSVIGNSYTIFYTSSYHGETNVNCYLYIGTAGNLKVQTAGGDIITFVAVPVGLFPLQVNKVFATGTGASNIVALW